MFVKVFLTREKHALSVLEILSERRSGINYCNKIGAFTFSRFGNPFMYTLE